MMKRLWFIFHEGDIVLERLSGGSCSVPKGEQPPIATTEQTHILNVSPMDNGDEVKAFMTETLPADHARYEMCSLRNSFYRLPSNLYLKAGKCQELLYWDRSTRFCGVCGAPMAMNTDISKRCTSCGKEAWPALATAVIVLIHKGNEVLLVHARNFKGNFHGLVAGFVETGETLEEAVRREVMEETGISIKNLRYFGSQPWPYPSGLMVGFNADYAGGDIRLQQEELSAGAWFSKNNLPQLPERMSIARMMLDDWLAK